MARKILCVAEKPSIAKAVAQHLGGGQVTIVCGIAYYAWSITNSHVAERYWRSLCQELQLQF